MKPHIQTAALLLVLARADLALAGLISVNNLSGQIQSSAQAVDFISNTDSSPPPNLISFGRADNPFNLGVTSSAAAGSATANSSAAQNWSFSLDPDSFDLTASGNVRGGTAIEYRNNRATTTANSGFAFSIYIDQAFSYSLSIQTSLQGGGPSVQGYTEVTFGGNQPFAFAGNGGYSHPGEPTSLSISGILPAGSYELDAVLGIGIQSGYSLLTSNGASGIADYTVTFHATTVVPEPGTALFGIACVGVSAFRRRRRA